MIGESEWSYKDFGTQAETVSVLSGEPRSEAHFSPPYHLMHPRRSSSDRIGAWYVEA